jgi:hypothetical protein
MTPNPTTQKTSEVRRARQQQRLLTELEWRRCARDKKYFIKNYVYIQVQPKWDPRGRTKFELFDYQEEALDTWNDNRFVVIVKARQLGFTTLAMADVLWHCLFQPGANLLLVSKNQDSANKNLGMVKFMYQFLPDWMKERGPSLTKAAEYKLEFEYPDGMRCQVKSFAGTETAGAGETATMVVLDEFALMPDPTNTYRTIMPTTDAGGRLLIISTARGAYNEFAKIYRGAKQKTNQFIPLFQPWNASRLISEKEYEAKRREFAANPWEFYSEYPSDDVEAFRESGSPRFASLPYEAEEFPFRGRVVEDENGLRFELDEDGPVWVTELSPDPDISYFIGADPAQGRGGDYSTAHVLTIDPDDKPRIVGFYRSNNIEPVEWAWDIDKLGRFFSGKYGAALLAVEDQGGQGQLPINELHRNLAYPRPYVYRPTGRRKNTTSDRLFSFPMSADRRRMVIDKLAEYLASADSSNPSLRGLHNQLLEELTQFVRQDLPGGGVRYAADYGCHDDLVMSLAIALWALFENADLSAPAPADSGRTTDRVVFHKMREIQEKNRLAAEQAEADSWDSIVLNGNYYEY